MQIEKEQIEKPPFKKVTSTIEQQKPPIVEVPIANSDKKINF